MANRAHFSDLLTPGFREIYDNNFKEVPMYLEKLFHVNTSEKADEKDSSISDFGLAVETGEEQPIPYEEPVQGYDKTYSHKKYAKGFKVSNEAFDDDLYRVFNKKPAALGRAMRRTAEDQASNVLNNGFTTTNANDLGGDGKPLFSTLHPRSDGGSSQSNASATGIAFLEKNLETAIIAMRKQKDEKGQKIDIYPKTIVVPIELRKTAHEIVDSPSRSGTADNDLNVYKNDFTIIDWLYLTSTTAWFLIDPTAHQLNWFWRRKAALKQDELFDTEVGVWKSTMRLSRGFSDWRGVWGSKGDGAGYAS
jgi:phage major head subunit gpT-like protein